MRIRELTFVLSSTLAAACDDRSAARTPAAPPSAATVAPTEAVQRPPLTGAPISVRYRVVPLRDKLSTNPTPFSETMSLPTDGSGVVPGWALYEAARKVALGNRKLVGVWQRNARVAPEPGENTSYQRVGEDEVLSTTYSVPTSKGPEVYIELVTWADGDPAPDCDLDCKTQGGCTAKDGACVAANDADCEKSDGCSMHGACSARAGRCRAATDADCKRSKACASLRACTAREGRCQQGGP